jgi:hypothetical protein
MLFEFYLLVIECKKTPPHFYAVFDKSNEISKALP